MVATQKLENLRIWLSQHTSGYLLASGHGEFLTAEAIHQLAESCDELEIEDHNVYLSWTNRSTSPAGYRFESIVAFPDVPNSRIQLKSTPLTFEEFMARVPGGLELCGGYLGGSIEQAFDLLDMSLETFGLLQVVRRAPKELWRSALAQVYGTEEGAELQQQERRDRDD